MGFIGDAAGAIGGVAGDLIGGVSKGISDPLRVDFTAQSANLLNPFMDPNTENAQAKSLSGLQQQQNFLSALAGQRGVQNQSSVFSQQQALANQLQGVANGTGPNPALQQLQNTTGQNVANQAALMASQRGAGANAGLIARQAAMQGSNIQQQAAGQASLLRAQQQLAGISALQQQQSLLGGTAGAQVNNLGNATLGYNQAAQSNQKMLLDALAQQNQANLTNVGNQNQTNAAIAAANAGQNSAIAGGLLSGAGSAGAAIAGGKGKAHGGYISNYAGGGEVSGPSSNVGRFLLSSAQGTVPQMSMVEDTTQNTSAPMIAASQGGPIVGELLAAQGKQVPGKANVSGDSLKNDTVPALLSPGEVVLPRSIMMGADAPEKAKAFVEAIMRKHGGIKK